MNRRLTPWLISLLFSFCLHSQEKGTISISSEPAGCWVKIDSVLVGKTPLDEFELDPGQHLIQVYPPNKGVWNLQEKIVDVSIRAGSNAPLNVVFSSPVFINSVPYGAQLFTENISMGFTPLYLPFEENAGKQFRLEKKGYRPYLFTLTSNQSIIAQLEGENGFVKDREKPRLLGFLPRTHLKSKFTLLAVSIAAHWASFYFKNIADQNYEKYQQTADPALMDQYWKQTQKYDKLSEVSLGVSFASLAGLIYFVIWK